MPAFGPHPKQFSQAGANEGDIIAAGVVVPTVKADPSYIPAPDPFPVGMIIDFAAATAPTGWLICDGSAISRTTYADLFAVLSITWGPGDGFTTFNLPNLQRRTTVGDGGVGTGTLGNTVGDIGGAETHTLSTAELASHSHGTSDPGHSHTASTTSSPGLIQQRTAPNGTLVFGQIANGDSSTGQVGSDYSWSTTVNSNSTGISISSAGSGTAHNNIQPSAVVRKLIKY